MILGRGQNAMTLDEIQSRICTQAKLLGGDCNTALLTRVLQHQGLTFEEGVAQSKDAVFYVMIIVVLYVGIILLLIGTNIKLGLCTNHEKRSRQLVSEFNEGNGTHSRMRTIDYDSNLQTPLAIQEDVVDV